MKKNYKFGEHKYIRIPLLSATVFAVIDLLYLCVLHLTQFLAAAEDGVITHTWWDISKPISSFWFNAHQPWSGFLQPYFIEIWTHSHYTEIDPSLIYQYEALCILQSVLIGCMVGVLIAKLKK